MSDCLPGGAAVMRQPSMVTSCVAPAKPRTSEKMTVHAIQCAGSPKATPANAIMTAICETMIQPRRRPTKKANSGGIIFVEKGRPDEFELVGDGELAEET